MSRIGIALAGGGPLGGIYEIGASVALAEAIEGLDFTRADIFVGVSSGSLVAAAFANGIAPQKLARILIDNDADEFFDPEMLLKPALGEYLNRALSVPQLLLSATRNYLADPLHRGLFESFQRLSRAIPTGLFDNSGIDRVMRDLLVQQFKLNQPFKLTGTEGKYDTVITLDGGGITGQVEAARLGIARALVAIDPAHKPALKAEDLMTRNPKEVERKKFGRKKARKRYQFSKR